jgi:hypothetical protein
MPKEIINSRYYGQEVPAIDGGSPIRVEPTHLHVGWTKDREHVEVAVINTDIKSEHPGDMSPGWFMQLDRAGCNRAIRALRKARDDAFGHDE